MSARPVLSLAGLALALLAAGSATAEEAESLNPIHALDRATFKGFVELPLFDPARRLPPPLPPAPVVVYTPPPPPPEPPPALQLVGILHGKRDMAVVHKDGADKALVLRNGEKLGNWIVAVHPLGVTLRNGDRSVDFAIFAKTVAAPPPQQPVAVGRMMRRAPDE